MNLVFLAAGIVLVIIVLVVRDQTQFALGRLRAELLALRSEEKRLGEEREDLERTVAQVSDALLRAGTRQSAAEAACREISEGLAALGVEAEGAVSPSAVPPEPGQGAG